MKKRIAIAAAIILALLIGMLFLKKEMTPHNYGTAKKECESFLQKNNAVMEEIAVNCFREGEETSGYYKEHHYSYENDFVRFYVGSQGMLGGQYWDLIYTKDGVFYGESEKYLYEEAGDGNNIIRAEKLDEHWWFLWSDYDGTDRSYK